MKTDKKIIVLNQLLGNETNPQNGDKIRYLGDNGTYNTEVVTKASNPPWSYIQLPKNRTYADVITHINGIRIRSDKEAEDNDIPF